MIIAPEEHGHNAGACMGANHRTDRGDIYFCLRKPGSNHVPQLRSDLQTSWDLYMAERNCSG